MNVFQEMGAAIAKLGAYAQFLKNKKAKVFGYGVFLVTVYFLLANVRGFFGAAGFMREAEPFIRENIPNFAVTNGQFYIEKPVRIEEDGMYISIDSGRDQVFSMSESEWNRELIDYEQVLIIDKNGFLMKNNGKIQMSEWPENGSFNREDLIGLRPYVTLIIIAFYIIYYIFAVGAFFFGTLFVALVCMLVATIQKYRFTFGQIYLMAIYGKTLTMLIKGVSRLTLSNRLSFLGLIYFVISCVYVCLAMGTIEKQRKQDEMNYGGGYYNGIPNGDMNNNGANYNNGSGYNYSSNGDNYN